MFARLSVTRLRGGVARRADRLLSSLHLVLPRRQPAQGFVQTPAPTAPTAPVTPEPALETASADFTREQVQSVLNDLVRPALQSDGGDIQLIDVIGNDVHVTLVGACHSCPSAVLTLKMGVDQLLREELPNFGELIQVNAFEDPIDPYAPPQGP